MIEIPFLRSLFDLASARNVFDDTVDRLTRQYSAIILLFFAFCVSAKQFVGSPIQCWMPMEFKGGWEEYAEDYCFIQNTYYVAFDQDIPDDLDDRVDKELTYYQWVPIFLVIQALGCLVPHFLWSTLNKRTGISVDEAVSCASKASKMAQGEGRNTEIGSVCEYLRDSLKFRSDRVSSSGFMCCRVGRDLGSSLTMFYIITKFVGVANLVIQLSLMMKVLAFEDTSYGFAAIGNFWKGVEWHDSGFFPRVTLCDFKVRRLANIHRYTVQCVLMINLFNEYIYLFLWCWFLFCAVAAIINLVYVIGQLAIANMRVKKIQKLASIEYKDMTREERDYQDGRDKDLMRSFTYNALRPDGVLVLRFIENYAGFIVAREIAKKLFCDYLEMRKETRTPHMKPKMAEDGFKEELGYDVNPYYAHTNDEAQGLMMPDSGKLKM